MSIWVWILLDLAVIKPNLQILLLVDVRSNPQNSRWLSLDFHLSDNGRHHRTDAYDEMMEEEEESDGKLLIVRRGKGFWLTLFFDRDLDMKQDRVMLVLETGKKKSEL